MFLLYRDNLLHYECYQTNETNVTDSTFFQRNNTQTKIIVALLFDFDISNKSKSKMEKKYLRYLSMIELNS